MPSPGRYVTLSWEYLWPGVKGWEELGWCPKEGGRGGELCRLSWAYGAYRGDTTSWDVALFLCTCCDRGSSPARWQVPLGSCSYSPFWPPAQALQFDPNIIQLVMCRSNKAGSTSHTKEMAKISRHGPAGSRGVSWNWVLKVLSQGILNIRLNEQ